MLYRSYSPARFYGALEHNLLCSANAVYEFFLRFIADLRYLQEKPLMAPDHRQTYKHYGLIKVVYLTITFYCHNINPLTLTVMYQTFKIDLISSAFDPEL